VPNVGRLGVIQDPQGAAIAIVQPDEAMAQHDASKAGEFSWSELMTSDHEAAFRFYSAIAGWEKVSEFDMGPMGKYLLWGRDGKQLGGMMTIKDRPPGWLHYVTTPDLDAALARAKSKGATVLNGPMEVPGGQRIVQLRDPQGAAFALVTPPAN
jgi:predicted enzyme related to lactoylglutathione lyase